MINAPLFSSKKQDWETPKKLFSDLDQEFHFTLDAAASKENTKCKMFFSESQNSLEQDWSPYESIFLNPPYETKLQNEFIRKAYQTHKSSGNTIVLLLPARTDTKRWHDYIFDKAEIRFLAGRLKFEVSGIPEKEPAPFPCAIVIYKN